jgi:hypothetical protein
MDRLHTRNAKPTRCARTSVVPADAGIHTPRAGQLSMGPGLRRDDGFKVRGNGKR